MTTNKEDGYTRMQTILDGVYKKPKRPVLAHGQVWRYEDLRTDIGGNTYTAIQTHTGIKLINAYGYSYAAESEFDGDEEKFTYIGMNPNAPKLFPEWITDRLPTKEDCAQTERVWIMQEGTLMTAPRSFAELGDPWLPIDAFAHCDPRKE